LGAGRRPRSSRRGCEEGGLPPGELFGRADTAVDAHTFALVVRGLGLLAEAAAAAAADRDVEENATKDELAITAEVYGDASRLPRRAGAACQVGSRDGQQPAAGDGGGRRGDWPARAHRPPADRGRHAAAVDAPCRGGGLGAPHQRAPPP